MGEVVQLEPQDLEVSFGVMKSDVGDSTPALHLMFTATPLTGRQSRRGRMWWHQGGGHARREALQKCLRGSVSQYMLLRRER